MPLLKRKPFSLAEPPKDLDPKEVVYQLRFTKEIFRDYREYLHRINLYRQRVWACTVTGKINLTYEEALVSEKLAAEKVQQLPKQLLLPALQTIQFSMLSLKDLADTIAGKLQEHILVGAELHARKDNCEYPCRVLKLIEDGDTLRYKVARLDRNRKVIDTSILSAQDLTQKKLPYTRSLIKSFIRESTFRSAPWVLHHHLAHAHGILTQLPPHLAPKVSLQNGLMICGNKRKQDDQGHLCGTGKRDKIHASTPQEEDVEAREEPIRYPIDDLLVRPGVDDPLFTDRPVPSTDFIVPMDCVGDLLMVWDFCSSFARLLHLSPFSLEDFESAVCHKTSNVVLLVEIHSSLLRLLLKDSGEYFSVVQKRNRSQKITLITWTDYLCDLLEIIRSPELGAHISTIKRGHYGLLDAHAKLGIFRGLVNCAVETDVFREKLEECIEERQAWGATKRGEAIEEARKKREEKEQLKSNGNGSAQNVVENGHDGEPERDDAVAKSESKGSETWSKKHGADSGKSCSRKEGLKELVKDEAKEEGSEKKSKEQRKEYYEREMEKHFVRTNALGKDREHKRYWWFRCGGRIFVESADSKHWGYYSSKEEVDALMGSLNCKGERERALRQQVQKSYARIRSEVEKRSKALTQKIALEEAVVRRSTRVRAPPRQNPAKAFLKYVNKWKEE